MATTATPISSGDAVTGWTFVRPLPRPIIVIADGAPQGNAAQMAAALAAQQAAAANAAQFAATAATDPLLETNSGQPASSVLPAPAAAAPASWLHNLTTIAGYTQSNLAWILEAGAAALAIYWLTKKK